ncbi:MAG: hypothetical protein ACR2JW_22370 [Thermomicrobiales bacterium]
MHLITTTLAAINLPTKVTLIAGYVVAVPALLGIVPALRNPAGRAPVVGLPNRAVIAAELLGAGSVTAGWFAAGHRSTNVVNVLWLIACTTIWLRSENKLRLQEAN